MLNLSLNFETEDHDDRKLVGMHWGQSFKFLRIIRVKERGVHRYNNTGWLTRINGNEGYMKNERFSISHPYT